MHDWATLMFLGHGFTLAVLCRQWGHLLIVNGSQKGWKMKQTETEIQFWKDIWYEQRILKPCVLRSP